MIFQILASAILLGVVLYAMSQARMSPKVAVLTVIVCLVGESLVLFPLRATAVAQLFGIGRGADLIFYFWTLFSLIVMLNLHLKLRSTNERFVALVRQLALNEAAEEEAEEKERQEPQPRARAVD